MSFAEYLADYQAREEEINRKYWQSLPPSCKELPPYPTAERMGVGAGPISLVGNCNLWGLIPFQGKAVAGLTAATSKESFDEQHASMGFTSQSLETAMAFARDSDRLRFHIMGPATGYSNLEFLEPLFREFEPPCLISAPIERIVGRPNFRGESDAFDDRAELRFYPMARRIFRQSKLPDDTIESYLARYRFAYVGLRLLGYDKLADTVDPILNENPPLAMLSLESFSDFIIQPKLDLTNLTWCFPTNELRDARFFGAIQGPKAPESRTLKIPYEVGRFILKQAVLYPETFEGCGIALDKYSDVELDALRLAFVKAIADSDPDSLTSTGEAVEIACKQVWERADSYSWLKDAGHASAVLSLAVVGGVAGSLVGEGLLGSVLGAVSTDFFKERTQAFVTSWLARLTGKAHMLAVYDFKLANPRSQP